MRTRKVPQRTCVGCGSTRDKRDLVRVVRTPEGTVVWDPSGKRSGRGAYVCGTGACLDLALSRHKLERALDVSLEPSVVDALREAVRHAES